MAEPLKAVYNPAYLMRLAQAISEQYPAFAAERFIEQVFDDQWEVRELKARTQHIRHCLHQTLALPYTDAIEILNASAPGFGGYEAMFFPDYVEAYGLEHWDVSMNALQWLTRFSSSEFAVRPFILRDQERMMVQMRAWSEDDNYHVRRLASEGCRPRLPWAQSLPLFKRDPSAIFPILDNLCRDEQDYVRRSVANNLNDIAKDHPARTLDWVQRNWQRHPHTQWIIKHGCRTLLKQAHPQAMTLFGYHPADEIEVTELKLSVPEVQIGAELGFRFQVRAGKSTLGRLRIEYAIDYLKANGRHSRKVFKISEGDFDDVAKGFERQQSFRQMTTRKHYPGEHRLTVLINGEEKAAVSFEVLA